MTGTIVTIPAGERFVDLLAGRLWDRADGDPLALSVMTVLLPTRRACRSLQEAFLRLGDGQPVLLPRLSPLGDVDPDELAPSAAIAEDLPDAIAPLRRLMILTQLVAQAPALAANPGAPASIPTDRALALAEALGALIDRVHTEQLSFDRLADLAPPELAHHWQQTVGFLEIVSRQWPALLAMEGRVDPAERRNLALIALAEAWQKAPPPGPVIAAGTTGSIPATRRLLQVIGQLPQGLIVLPGLDVSLPEPAWQALGEDHPQFGLRQLLAALGVERQDVASWHGEAPHENAEARRALLSVALRPADHPAEPLAPGWLRAALIGFERADFATEQAEAEGIAAMLRLALDRPARTAALVTPDRMLARRVAAALTRWGIGIDDSGGVGLDETPPGSLLRRLARLIAEGPAPVVLMDLLKHPLAALGRSPADRQAALREIELGFLRNPGIDDPLAALGEAGGPAAQMLADLLAAIGPFEGLTDDRLDRFMLPLAAAAERIADDDRSSGAARLWQGEAGEAARRSLIEIIEAGSLTPRIERDTLPAILDRLLAAQTIRPGVGRHPRLAILGPLEARLIQPDLMILGGLNEGTWPGEPPVDPWMSRPMRRDFGLPLPERGIGLSAHDFVQAAAAPEVIVTRALRSAGAPTLEARWLSRLTSTLLASDAALLADWQAGARWQGWALGLDQPAQLTPPRKRPAPTPPAEARPKSLFVTRIEQLRRDPYGFYARDILKLRPVEPIERGLEARDRGTIIHAALEAFLKTHGGALPADALARLLETGREAFGPALAVPEVAAFWWPRFARIAEWFIAHETERRADGITPVAVEQKGVLALGDGFEVAAKADRIDRLADGRLQVIDYKTGSPPRRSDVESGHAPQLTLAAAIAAAGGFAGVSGRPAAPAYWQLTGLTPVARITEITSQSPEALAAAALAGAEALLRRYAQAETPFVPVPDPDHAPAFNDYERLSRAIEWRRPEESGDG